MVEDSSIAGGEFHALISRIQRTRPDEPSDDSFGFGHVDREAIMLQLRAE
jgi:hypothetical protein